MTDFEKKNIVFLSHWGLSYLEQPEQTALTSVGVN